uniref:Uncharacterized protein n=1 Tax=Micrurus carvalhoi TaxID=3147026 RepID=A0A2H6NAW4_9SAUR
MPKDHAVLPEHNEKEGSTNSCWEDEGKKEAKEILGPEAQIDESGCPVKDECDSDAENEQNHDPNVEEFLQQEDTAVIYPEAPEEEQHQGTPDASGQDENVTSYNNVVEANSDSDDEDKLHIVEEESVVDGTDCDNSVPDDDLPKDHAVFLKALTSLSPMCGLQ